MFLHLAHTRLEIYKYTEALVLECYRVTNLFPKEERFGLTQQVRPAAISVHLKLAEGCSRRSKAERIRFFEISRSSAVEIGTAIGIAHKLLCVTLEELQVLGELIIKTFKLLSGMISPADPPSLLTHPSPLTTESTSSTDSPLTIHPSPD